MMNQIDVPIHNADPIAEFQKQWRQKKKQLEKKNKQKQKENETNIKLNLEDNQGINNFMSKKKQKGLRSANNSRSPATSKNTPVFTGAKPNLLDTNTQETKDMIVDVKIDLQNIKNR